MSKSKNTVSKLEVVCKSCNGRKKVYGVKCDSCHGSGYETTAIGRRVLDLMRHNFKSMLEDMASSR